MAFDETLATDRDKARALLGDTGTPALLTDTYMDAVLGLYSFNAAVSFMANGLAAKYAQEPDRVTLPSGLSVSWAERVKYWTGLALSLGGVSAGAAFAVQLARTDGYSALAAE